MNRITHAFERIREAAGLPKFRLYDCRVQAITKLLSDPKRRPSTNSAYGSRVGYHQFSVVAHARPPPLSKFSSGHIFSMSYKEQ